MSEKPDANFIWSNRESAARAVQAQAGHRGHPRDDAALGDPERGSGVTPFRARLACAPILLQRDWVEYD